MGKIVKKFNSAHKAAKNASLGGAGIKIAMVFLDGRGVNVTSRGERSRHHREAATFVLSEKLADSTHHGEALCRCRMLQHLQRKREFVQVP